MTNKEPIQLTMNMLLGMQPEIFRDTVKSQPLGFNKSLQNLIKSQFEQCNMAKTSLQNVLVKGKDKISEEDKKEMETTIKDLYICMQLLEDRHTILKLVIEEVESRDLKA